MISNFQISNHTLGEANIHRRGHSLKQTFIPTVLDTGYHFVYCRQMSAMANRIQKIWINYMPFMSQFWGWFCLQLTNVCFDECLLQWMSASMNVCFDECLLLRMSASTNVCFDKCLLRRMSASTNVCFDECPLWRMSASTNVCFDKCLLRQMSALTNVCLTKHWHFLKIPDWNWQICSLSYHHNFLNCLNSLNAKGKLYLNCKLPMGKL
jgi:hypothetical protein